MEGTRVNVSHIEGLRGTILNFSLRGKVRLEVNVEGGCDKLFNRKRRNSLKGYEK